MSRLSGNGNDSNPRVPVRPPSVKVVAPAPAPIAAPAQREQRVTAPPLCPMDAEIIRRRQAGEVWRAIADAMDRSESWLHFRMNRLRALRCPDVAPPQNKGGGHGEWDGRTIARLRADWAAGYSTAEIARRLHTSKNAVVGKAHRLDLPARPSPIRSGGPGAGVAARQKAAREAAGGAPLPRGARPPMPPDAATLAPLASLAAPMPARAAPTPPSRPPPSGAMPGRVPMQYVREVAPPARYGRVVECAWCLNDTGRPRDFRFCDAPSEPGRPFCAEHGVGAYQRAPDRREDAPAARVPA